MRKWIIAAIVLLASYSLSAKSSKEIYTEYSSRGDIKALRVTPDMLALMSGEVPFFSGVKVSDIAKNFKIGYMLENVPLSTQIRSDINELLETGAFEQIVKERDGAQLISGYVSIKDDRVKEIVISVVGMGVCTFVSVCVDFSMEDFANLMSKVDM